MGEQVYRLRHVLHFLRLSQVAMKKRLRHARFVVVALLLGGAACAGALFPLATFSPQSVALACGIGNVPTMYAGNGPALLYPLTKTSPADQPQGIFLLNYVVGQPITFSEDFSNMISPPAKTSLKWLWTFGDGTQSNDISPTHTYTKPGTYNVHAQIFDGGQWQDFDSAAIHVVAQPFTNLPVATVTASTTYVVPGGSITFDASGSHSQDGGPLTYLWNFNDGSTATGPHVTHQIGYQYADGSTGIVGLVVTDDRGARSFASVKIHIVSQLPTVAVSASLTTIGTGGTVTFDASQSSAPSNIPNDQIVQYIWNFGDGSPVVTTQTPTITHTFPRAGKFTVTVQAVDQRGIPGTQTLLITVIAVTSASGGPSPLLYLGIVALLAILAGGAYLYFARQRQLRSSLAYRRATAGSSRRPANSTPGRPPQRNSGNYGNYGSYGNYGAHQGPRGQQYPQGPRPTRPNNGDGYPPPNGYGRRGSSSGGSGSSGSSSNAGHGQPHHSRGPSQVSGSRPRDTRTPPRQQPPYGPRSHERE